MSGTSNGLGGDDYFIIKNPQGICSDGDQDGYSWNLSPYCSQKQADCDDANPRVNPGIEEICQGPSVPECPLCFDGADNDCDGDSDFLDNGCNEVADEFALISVLQCQKAVRFLQ